MYRQAMTSNQPPKKIALNEKAFVFGGAYSNLQATQVILRKAAELGFHKSEIIFTGDMIAYCANPVETVQLIKSKVDHIIMGNCEEAIANGANNCGCGFEEGSECSILSNQWYNFCLSKIDNETARWMGKLPKQIFAQIGDHNFLATHATPCSINQFIFPSSLKHTETCNKVDGYIVGHSGIPFIGSANKKPWLNSRASGMPANDGTSRVWYATIRNLHNQIFIETHSLEYDFIQAQSAMASASLNNGYMQTIKTGIWPSHDVLPDIEKKPNRNTTSATKKGVQKNAFKRNHFSLIK